jgi:hypothetical protein
MTSDYAMYGVCASKLSFGMSGGVRPPIFSKHFWTFGFDDKSARSPTSLRRRELV